MKKTLVLDRADGIEGCHQRRVVAWDKFNARRDEDETLDE